MCMYPLVLMVNALYACIPSHRPPLAATRRPATEQSVPSCPLLILVPLHSVAVRRLLSLTCIPSPLFRNASSRSLPAPSMPIMYYSDYRPCPSIIPISPIYASDPYCRGSLLTDSIWRPRIGLFRGPFRRVLTAISCPPQPGMLVLYSLIPDCADDHIVTHCWVFAKLPATCDQSDSYLKRHLDYAEALGCSRSQRFPYKSSNTATVA